MNIYILVCTKKKLPPQQENLPAAGLRQIFGGNGFDHSPLVRNYIPT
jgi:hypothetical protein